MPAVQVVRSRDQSARQIGSRSEQEQEQADNGLGSTLQPAAASSPALGHNAKIAIAVTIPVCVLMALLAAFIFVTERKRRAAKREGRAHQSTRFQRPNERKGSCQPPLLQPEPEPRDGDALQVPSTADSKYEKDFEHHELGHTPAATFGSFNFSNEDDKQLPIHPPRNDSIVNPPSPSSPYQDDPAGARQQFIEAPQSPQSPQRHSTTDQFIVTTRFSTIEGDTNNRFSHRHSTFIDSDPQIMVTVVDHDISEALAGSRDSMRSMGVQEITHAPDETTCAYTDRDSSQSGYGIAITQPASGDNNRHSTVWNNRRFSQRNPYNQLRPISLHPDNGDANANDNRVSRLASSRYSKAPEGFDFNIEPPTEPSDVHLDNTSPGLRFTHASETFHPNVFRASQRLSRLDEPGPDPLLQRFSVQELPESHDAQRRILLDPSTDIQEPKSA